MNVLAFFEFLPVPLAFMVAISCSRAYHYSRRRADRVALITATIASILLILGQTSWYTVFLSGGDDDPFWIKVIWKTFDSLAMLSFIIMSHRTRYAK